MNLWHWLGLWLAVITVILVVWRGIFRRAEHEDQEFSRLPPESD
jgi:hypothetical protein